MNLLNRYLPRLLAAAFTAAMAAAASAAPLTGAVSFTGTICLGSSPSLPAPTECTHQDASDLTYLDFINGALAPAQTTPTPGEPGKMSFLTTLGDLDPLFGQIGLMYDLDLPGPADPLDSFTPMTPLWSAIGSDGDTYTFNLTSLISVFRLNDHALDVRGFGDLCREGTDCNVFSFLFTTQDADNAVRTTFSASQSTFVVTEPAPLALLGLGLLGIAAAARRGVG